MGTTLEFREIHAGIRCAGNISESNRKKSSQVKGLITMPRYGVRPVRPHVELTDAVLCKHARGFSLIMGATGTFFHAALEGWPIGSARMIRGSSGPRSCADHAARGGQEFHCKALVIPTAYRALTGRRDRRREAGPASSEYEYGTFLACWSGCICLVLYQRPDEILFSGKGPEPAIRDWCSLTAAAKAPPGAECRGQGWGIVWGGGGGGVA